MFDDLDATIKAMLDDPAAPAELRAADVSFDAPDADFTPALATVNLFLHEVTENRALRDNARVMVRTGDTYGEQPPPMRMDCKYLITTWSAQSGGLQAAEEHRLLGLALLWLGRFPVLEERFVRGRLLTPAQPYPLHLLVAQTQEGRSNSEFWSALGIAPRLAISATVTVTVMPYDEYEEFPVVQSMHLTVKPD